METTKAQEKAILKAKGKTVIKNNKFDVNIAMSEGFTDAARSVTAQAQANYVNSLACLELAQKLSLGGVSAIKIEQVQQDNT